MTIRKQQQQQLLQQQHQQDQQQQQHIFNKCYKYVSLKKNCYNNKLNEL